jgi:L-lactate dehydrogenase complex protein LldG
MSRDAFYAKLRQSLAGGPSEPQRRAAAAARIASPPKHPEPARVQKPAAELMAQFRGFLEGQGATVIDVADAAAVPEAIADYLRRTNLPSRLRMGADAWLEALPWSKAPALVRDAGRAADSDDTSLSRAVAAVAETGTLMLASGPDNPVSLTFLPETHIVVVDAADLVGPYEAALSKIRARYGKGEMPRTVNFVSGPSRTGDIGGKLVMGAHGPRRLCVIVVGADRPR